MSAPALHRMRWMHTTSAQSTMAHAFPAGFRRPVCGKRLTSALPEHLASERCSVCVGMIAQGRVTPINDGWHRKKFEQSTRGRRAETSST